jgi:DNA-binding transcriptional LysR family regulator
MGPESPSTMPPNAGIEIRHLRYFLAVFEELHFGRAAERLHIAQPPLSQAIRKLEEALGVQLFVRTSRVVEPTAAGMALAEEARRVLAAFEFAVLETQRVGMGSIALRIGCLALLPAKRLHGFLAALKRRDATLQAEVTHLWGLEQVERLLAGRLDLGLFLHIEDYAGLEHEPLYPGEEIMAFLPNGHSLAAKEAVTPGDLESETQLTLPREVNPEFYDRYMRLFADAGYRFRDLQELNTHDPRDALLAVGDGLGIAFGPSSLPEIGEEGRLVVGRRLDPPLRLPDTVVAWRASAPRRLRSQLGLVREAARELHQSALAAA